MTWGGAGFHPLYRGTWYLICITETKQAVVPVVSIRYIAVLGI